MTRAATRGKRGKAACAQPLVPSDRPGAPSSRAWWDPWDALPALSCHSPGTAQQDLVPTPNSNPVYYAGVFLTPTSQRILGEAWPPTLAVRSGDHVTLAFRPDHGTCQALPLGQSVLLRVLGCVTSNESQVVAVSRPSGIPYLNPSPPHITISCAEGVAAARSGEVLRAALGARALQPLAGTSFLHGLVGVRMTDGRTITAPAELESVLRGAEGPACVGSAPPPLRVRPRSAPSTPPASEAAPGAGDPRAVPEAGEGPVAEAASAGDSGVSIPIPGRAARPLVPASVVLPSRHVFRVLDRTAKDRGAPAEEQDPEARDQAAPSAEGGDPAAHCSAQPGVGGHAELAAAERAVMAAHVQARAAYREAAASCAEGEEEHAAWLQKAAQSHAALARAARQRANALSYIGSNSVHRNEFTLDLHGMHVEEALEVLKRHLHTFSKLGHPGGVFLKIITGKGKHSTNQAPKLLPAVTRYLAAAGYESEGEWGNEGVMYTLIE
ncbi:hypothetical protein ACKKBF_B09285 [Auxenochlorella protothecoides x Auxenochlorella symbiontica]